MGILIMIGQLLLSLSILIVLHEMGHFFPAKLFGTRVEKFYLFFDPWFELFKIKRGETEYGIGWLPLGGYVKISGMIDESMDREQMKQPPQPWEFRSKPAWQRLIIMLGGVTVNFILGFAIYAMVLAIWGEEYLPTENAIYGIHTDSLGQELGLQTGDFVISVGDAPFDEFFDRAIIREIIINNAQEIKIKRDGQEKILPVAESAIGMLSNPANKDRRLFMARMPFVISKFSKESSGREAGLEVGDKLVGIDSVDTPFYDVFTDVVKGKESQTVLIRYIRDGQTDTSSVNVTLSDQGKLGAFPTSPLDIFDTRRIEYSIGQALPAGVVKGWGLLTDQIKAFGQIFRGKLNASDTLGGFGTIARMYGDEWIWERFWRMTAILSLILAFMNLLPIPALDGGHVMFLLYEVVTGRKPSDKFMEYATIVGFIIVISLVVYANFLDFFR
ncbi:MAG: RIP metalloprotease RseP [Bacteroidota bacterium]